MHCTMAVQVCNDCVLMLQVDLQTLSQQLNDQILGYAKKGFDVKDISSGMTSDIGETLKP